MTKKLLLSAAALGVMAFAGAAGAADITSGRISGVPLAVTAGKVSGAYAVANEAVLPAAGITTTATKATTELVFGMDSPVTVSPGGQMPFAVTFTLTGPATFAAQPAFTDLLAAGEAPKTGVVILSADKKSVSFFVEYGDTAALTISSLNLINLDLKVTAKEAVSIAAEAKVTVAGFTQTVSVVNPTKIIEFKNVVKPSTAATYTAEAALTTYKAFTAAGAVAPALANATATTVTSNPIALTENAGVYKTLAGGTALTVSNVLNGATAVVTGPQVTDLGVTLAGSAAAAEGKTATSGTYTLINSQLIDPTVTGSLVLNNPTATAKVIEQGTYSVALKPIFATDYAGNADQTLNLVKVELAGTNFVAPWFALDNAGANSTLRLANNGSAAVGPVIISLKANNGSAAPTGTHTIASIPAGGFVSVTGATLKAAFGTNAANGDLQVTIQSDTANVSAKVRTTQSTGQIFENSLGTVAK